ncbi:MAG: UbiA family prenyltransferase [Flavobacteriales bacterium]
MGHSGPASSACPLTAIPLQVLSNLANDLGDHVNGADNAGRVGPQRSVQSGRISAAAMKRAMLVCGLLAFASGVALLLVGTGLGPVTGLFLLLGLAAIAAAVKYTYGASSMATPDWGTWSVLIFFCLAGVA